MPEIIDRKFKFLAVNPCNGKTYTEKNAVIFCAKDKAFIPALLAYHAECVKIGCETEHLKSVSMLITRVANYQQDIESRKPDTNLTCEIERCIEGKNLDK